MESLKKDVNDIKNKIKECKDKGVNDNFDIEMTIMTELPDLYNDYPWLIKRLSKSDDDFFLNKFIEDLDAIEKGEKSRASVELKLGVELKEKFVDPILEKEKNKKKIN